MTCVLFTETDTHNERSVTQVACKLLTVLQKSRPVWSRSS